MTARAPSVAAAEPAKDCPRAKSDMTPCFLKDGDLAVGLASTGWGAGQRKICVGCEWGIAALRASLTDRSAP